MTKDRRLGRGLAALLGTQVEEGTIPIQQSPNSLPQSPIQHSSFSLPVNVGTGVTIGATGKSSEPAAELDSAAVRNETIRAMTKDAHARMTPNRSGMSPITIPMAPAETTSVASATTLDIETGLIDANPFQPRRQFNPSEIESLAESLKEHKQLQPILVRRVGQRYQLISGERRLRATVLAGLPTIRAEVRQADDRLVAELAIIENLQRKDLNAIEKALSFKRYITEHKCTQDELAQRLKIDRSTIANMMRLLELPDSITDAVQRDEVSAGHAKALLSLGSIKEQVAFLKKIREEGWSVRETEARVAEAIAAAADAEDGVLGVIPRRKASKSDQLSALENEIKMYLGTRVDISQTSRGRGRITIHFTSIEEFDRLKHVLSNEPRRKAA